MCNAQNHRPGCNCGWGGGYHAGGYGGGRADGVGGINFRIADGRIWSRPGALTCESFTNPNALCPVCGASVYFYQSPHGGRVFFDDLGPPWPKHACTTQAYIPSPRRAGTRIAAALNSANQIFQPPTSPQPATRPVSIGPHTWRPLVSRPNLPMTNLGAHVRFPVDHRWHLPGGHVYLPYRWFMAGPIYWRWHPEHLGWIQLSSVDVGSGSASRELQTSIPGWLQSDAEYQAWIADPERGPSPEQLSKIWKVAWRHPHGQLHP